MILEGTWTRLEPLDAARHGGDLWYGTGGEANSELWRYLSDGPFPNGERKAFNRHLEAKAASKDPLFYAIIDRATGRALGHAALMRIEPADRCVEVGHVLYSPELQCTRQATEAMYLLARYVFENLNYRRYEWKCDSLNEPSRRAALRLGFTFEGLFRQHKIVKGLNRDTAWYSILDSEWPLRKVAFERWLDPANFDAEGKQRVRLSTLMAAAQVT